MLSAITGRASEGGTMKACPRVLWEESGLRIVQIQTGGPNAPVTKRLILEYRRGDDSMGAGVWTDVELNSTNAALVYAVARHELEKRGEK